MKKTMFIITSLFIALFFAACASQPDVGQSPTSSPTPMVSPSSPPSTPEPTPEPTPAFIPDTDIPDITNDPSEISVNSNSLLQEDDEYIYYMPPCSYDKTNIIYRISKEDNSKAQIAQGCRGYAVNGGIVYYIGPNEDITEEEKEIYSYYNELRHYNTDIGETKKILETKESICEIALYNGRLYYAFERSAEFSKEFYTELHSCLPDGSDNHLVVKNACGFSFYKEKIYFGDSSAPDGTVLFECDLDGSNVCEIGWMNFTYNFGAKHGKLFYSDHPDEGDWNFNIQDINTKEIKQFEDFGKFALLGQYLIFIDNDNILSAYDIRSGEFYKLLKINSYKGYDLYTTPYGAYLLLTNTNDLTELDRIIISGGKASLEKVAELREE